jgi:hypothetical protein
VDDRLACPTPGSEEIGDPLLCVRIVPSGITRIVQSLLDVDDE